MGFGGIWDRHRGFGMDWTAYNSAFGIGVIRNHRCLDSKPERSVVLSFFADGANSNRGA